MSDIVERLHDHDRHIRGRLIEGLTDLVIDDMVEAADEIERLREGMREIMEICDKWSPYTSSSYELITKCTNITRATLGEKE